MDRTNLTLSPPGDNGTITFWDYNSGTAFQTMEDIPQPGSLEAEAGVFCSTFDVTGTRLITGCADKTIKVRKLFLCCVVAVLVMHYFCDRSMRSKRSK
jgi:WD40 repeat protein